MKHLTMKHKKRSKALGNQPTKNSGFTIVEVLIAAAISLIILTICFSTVISTEKLFRSNQKHSRDSANVSYSLDLVGNEIRRSGDFLKSYVPALEIVNGGYDTNTESDAIIIRRGLDEASLSLCAEARSGTTFLDIADDQQLVNHCLFEDNDNNDIPDTLDGWQTRRANNENNSLLFYLYSPITGEGEILMFKGVNSSNGTHSLMLASGPNNNYPASSQLYLIEEKHYFLKDKILTEYDPNTGEDLSLSYGLVDLQTTFVFEDGDRGIAFDFGAGQTWRDIKGVEINLTLDNLEAISSYVPRNVLSVDD